MQLLPFLENSLTFGIVMVTNARVGTIFMKTSSRRKTMSVMFGLAFLFAATASAVMFLNDNSTIASLSFGGAVFYFGAMAIPYVLRKGKD